jgi:hypothetical protein
MPKVQVRKPIVVLIGASLGLGLAIFKMVISPVHDTPIDPALNLVFFFFLLGWGRDRP